MDTPKKDRLQVPGLHDILRKMSGTYGWDSHLAEEHAKEVFKSLLDAKTADHLVSLFVHDGLLFARLDSAAARQELSYRKEMLRQAINEKLHGEVIKTIVIQ